MNERNATAIRDALTATDWRGDLDHIETLALTLAMEAADSEQDHSADDIAAVFRKVAEIVVQLDEHGDLKV